MSLLTGNRPPLQVYSLADRLLLTAAQKPSGELHFRPPQPSTDSVKGRVTAASCAVRVNPRKDFTEPLQEAARSAGNIRSPARFNFIPRNSLLLVSLVLNVFKQQSIKGLYENKNKS